MPYPILIARKQKIPPPPFTEGHQRHRHICSSAYLGSEVHFWSNSPWERTMLCFSVKGMNRICFYWKQNPMGLAPRTPIMCSNPWLVFSPLSKARAGIKHKTPEHSYPVLSSAVWLHGPTHLPVITATNWPLDFLGLIILTPWYKFCFEELKNGSTAIGSHLEVVILSGSTSFKYSCMSTSHL